LKSSAVIELTESETEYVVTAVKHLFKEHLVLQYDIKNTLPDTVLADVTVVCTPSAADESEDSGLEEEFTIPAPLLKTDEPGTVYVSFKRPEGQEFVAANFTNVLRFTSKEIDPSTNEPEEHGYDDEYEISDMDLVGSDYIVPAFAGNFDSIFNSIPSDDEHEAEETLQLANTKTLAEATEQLVKTLGMQPLEGSEVTLSTSTHSLKLYGKSVTGGKVASLVRMAFSAKSGVTVNIKVRSEEEMLAALVIGGVA
jgi:coatomer protein complex subunit gamma